MFNIGPWELIIILVIILIIFGPGKLPDIGKALGKGLKEFKKANNEDHSETQTKKLDSAKQEEDKKQD